MSYYRHAQEFICFVGLNGQCCRHPSGPNNYQRVLAYGFQDESACNIMAFSDHTRDDITLTH